MTDKLNAKFFLYNTLSRRLEQFTPLSADRVAIYGCGPTVYDNIHLGNARAFIVYDLLYRLLTELYGQERVRYVRNITDIDDKINARAKELAISINQLTSTTIANFHRDMHYLNIIPPTAEPRATQYIGVIIELINTLLQKGHAYVVAGNVYFIVNNFDAYFALSKRNIDNALIGVRIETDQYKRNQADFVLWKASNEKDDPSAIFISPWGLGRPGWHIECSAMSQALLGQDFDIHLGGIDLAFPHHTNEIAQSKSAFPGSIHARYWVHNGFLTVHGEKMSKSLNNFITIADLAQRRIPGETIRLALMNAHYRKRLNFSDEAINNAQKQLDYLYRSIAQVSSLEPVKADDEFLSHLLQDLHVPAAIVVVQQLANKANAAQADDKKMLLQKMKSAANMLGLLYSDPQEWLRKGSEGTDELDSLIEQRRQAKLAKNWQLADGIREKISQQGIIIEDHAGGTTWRKASEK